MENVNKQLLDALKGLLELHDNPAPFSGKTGEERMLALENQVAKRNALIYSARQAIAAAEQAQQAEPVARDAMALANEVRDAVIAEITKDNIVSITGAVIKRAKRIDLSVIVDRYAAQPPAVAVPDGYALVPIEPTRAMLDAAKTDLVRDGEIDPMLKWIYRAMLTAMEQPK